MTSSSIVVGIIGSQGHQTWNLSQEVAQIFNQISTTGPGVYDELSPCFRRYAAKKVRDTVRTLIFLRAPRRNKVFPSQSQSSWGNSQSHSRDLPSQSQSSRGLPDQDQPQHFRAREERPTHQASYQLLKIIKSKIIQDYFSIFSLSKLSGTLPVPGGGSSSQTKGGAERWTSCDSYQCVLHMIYHSVSVFNKIVIFSNLI